MTNQAPQGNPKHIRRRRRKRLAKGYCKPSTIHYGVTARAVEAHFNRKSNVT